MKLLDTQTTVDAVKLLVFMVVTSLATGLLVITIGNVTFGESKEYKAVFSDVTGLNTGDDVRIAGVRVGSVKSIDIVDRAARRMVTFTWTPTPSSTRRRTPRSATATWSASATSR